MDLTISINAQVVQQAKRLAQGMGMSLDQLISQYLEAFCEEHLAKEDAEEFRRLSGQGDSQGWKFDRDEIHERS
jgi:hypothetical protein